ALHDLINQDTYGVSVEEAGKKIEADLMTRFKTDVARIQDCLMDEYRVRIAQTYVLGAAPGLNDAAPSYVTPHEFYKFFRDNRTAVKAQLLPLEAEAFIDKVTEKAS